MFSCFFFCRPHSLVEGCVPILSAWIPCVANHQGCPGHCSSDKIPIWSMTSPSLPKFYGFKHFDSSYLSTNLESFGMNSKLTIFWARKTFPFSSGLRDVRSRFLATATPGGTQWGPVRLGARRGAGWIGWNSKDLSCEDGVDQRKPAIFVNFESIL